MIYICIYLPRLLASERVEAQLITPFPFVPQGRGTLPYPSHRPFSASCSSSQNPPGILDPSKNINKTTTFSIFSLLGPTMPQVKNEKFDHFDDKSAKISPFRRKINQIHAKIHKKSTRYAKNQPNPCKNPQKIHRIREKSTRSTKKLWKNKEKSTNNPLNT